MITLTAVGYAASVVAANWIVTHVGLVPVGFGFVAPAAVYIAGLTFSLRDLLQDAGGRLAVVAAVATGVLISAVFSPPALLLGSALAFGASELADMAVYTPLRQRGRVRALVASNAVGLVVDSILFLWLAFGSLAFLPGQIVGKAWATLAAVGVVLLLRMRRGVR